MAVQPFEEVVVIVGAITLFVVSYLLVRSLAHRSLAARPRRAGPAIYERSVALKVPAAAAPPASFEDEVRFRLDRLSEQVNRLETAVGAVDRQLHRSTPTLAIEAGSILVGFVVSLIGTALLQPSADEVLPRLLAQASALVGGA